MKGRRFKLLKTIVSANRIRSLVKTGGTRVLKMCKRRGIKRLILAPVLTGSMIFTADLAREIHRQQERSNDPEIKNIEFILDTISCWRYGKETTSNRVIEIRKQLDHDPKDEHILFIEDIIDVGLTGRDLAQLIRAQNPAGLYLISLLQKPARTIINMQDYFDEVIVLQEIDDVFVQGYGLDDKGKGRINPAIVCEIIEPVVVELSG